MANTPFQSSQVPGIPDCWFVEPETREKTESGSWRAYWEELSDDQQIFREQSDEYVRNVLASLISDRVARVLDFGCGFGHVAKMLAPHVGELHLWDASANMRRRARLNVAGCQNIRFLDLSNPESDDSQLQFELILVNSVVQYMTFEEFSAWLLRWRRMLGAGGRIVVSDLIPPRYPALRDIVDLLKFSARRGFLVRAVWQAFSEIWSYWGVRRARPLSRIGREELSRVGEDSGLAVSFLPVNLTHFTKRLTAVFSFE